MAKATNNQAKSGSTGSKPGRKPAQLPQREIPIPAVQVNVVDIDPQEGKSSLDFAPPQEFSNLQPVEPIADTSSILNAAFNNMPVLNDVDDYDALNQFVTDDAPPRLSEQLPNAQQYAPSANMAALMEDFTPIPENVIPQIRKVVIKKITRYKFRMGMERDAESPELVPGTAHTWVPDKKGNEFLTGLEDKPDERLRLERLLRVDLSPTSNFWATLSLRLEAKRHGMILNFDDYAMGAFYEVCYYAMTASSLIAKSLKEYNSGKKPFSEWYIENKEAEAEEAGKQVTAMLDAVNEYRTMSGLKRRNIAKLAGLAIQGLTDAAAGVALFHWIEGRDKDGKVQGDGNASNFMRLVSLSDTEIVVRVLVKDAIRLNIIRKDRAGEFRYNQEPFGHTEDQIVGRLVLPQNSNLRVAIQRQIDALNR